MVQASYAECLLMVLALTTALALFFAPSSTAHASFGLKGEGLTRHLKWARAAQLHVPLPNERIRVVEDWDLLPEYFAPQPELGLGAQINLPRPGRGGWDYHSEHGLFLHELGHSFDHANVTPLLRKRFKVLAGTKCSWRAAHCRFRDRWDRTSVLDSPPGEWFAEMYASCALGISQAEYQLEGYNTYGWLPPDGSDSAICSLLSAARHFKR
jgi:hypothetical protein